MFPFIVNSREFRNRRCHLRCAVERSPARLSHLEKRGFSHGLLPPVDPPWCRADRSIGPGPEPGEVCDTRQGLVRVPVGCRATGASVVKEGQVTHSSDVSHSESSRNKRRKGRVAHPVAMWASLISATARDGTQKTKPKYGHRV